MQMVCEYANAFFLQTNSRQFIVLFDFVTHPCGNMNCQQLKWQKRANASIMSWVSGDCSSGCGAGGGVVSVSLVGGVLSGIFLRFGGGAVLMSLGAECLRFCGDASVFPSSPE